jgi:outer membrane receptor protein involved in Fe transport
VLFGALAAGGAAASAPPPQNAQAPASAQVPAAPAEGVVRYGPAFFDTIRAITAWDIIQKLPGFSFDPGQQVRGFAGAAGNVLVDGDRPTTKEDNLQAILQRIPASQVDHIDLIRGGAPGIDMHGQTVLANVIRKAGSGMTGVLAVAGNVYPDGRANGAARIEMTKKWDGKTFELSLLPSSFIDDGAGDGNRVRTDPDGNVLIRSHLDPVNAGGFQMTGTSSYETPSAGGKLRINLYGYFQHYYDNEDDHLTPPGEEDLRYRQNRAKGELDLHFEKKLSPKWFLEALAIEQVQHNEHPSLFITTTETDDFSEDDTSSETIARAVLRYRSSDKLSVETSAEGAFNIQSSDSTFALNGADVPLPAAKVTVSEKRGEVAALTTWSPSHKLTLETGIRTEVSQIASSGDTVLSKVLVYPKPRAVLTWSLSGGDQVRYRIEREVGQLNFGDFAASSALGNGNSVLRAGNPDINPYTDWAFEGAYEKHFKNGVVAVLTFRHLIISDVEDRIPIEGADGSVFDAPGNIGSASENDILANFTVPLGWLGIKNAQIKAQGTLRHSRVRDPETGIERTISGQHRFDYEVHFTQSLPQWKSSWGIDVFNRSTEAYFRFNETDVYKIKTWVDAYYEYKPRPDLALHAEIDNIGGRGFQRLLYVYNGPRPSGLAYIDNRKQDFKPYLYFRIRKTFG